MRAQRVRGGESRIEMQTVKWTAEGIGNGKRQVFHDVKVYVSYRRYAGISQRVWSKKIINQGGTASGKEMTPVLDRIGYSVRDFFYITGNSAGIICDAKALRAGSHCDRNINAVNGLRYSTNFQT